MTKESKDKGVKNRNLNNEKIRLPHLNRLRLLDQCFRNPNPAKCTLEAIGEIFRNHHDFGEAIAKSTFHYYLQVFRDELGAQFKGQNVDKIRKSDKLVNGKKQKNKYYSFAHAKYNGVTYYQYEDIDAPLPGLQDAIGKVRQDTGVALMKILQNDSTTPVHIWLRLFLEHVINDKSTSLNIVSFNENIDLDYQNMDKFERLLQAILNKQPLKLHYVNKAGKSNDPCVLPYRLKNYNQRWYLIAKCHNPCPRSNHPDEFYRGYSIYAIDGITDVVDTDGVTIIRQAIENWDYPYIEPDEEELNELYDDVVGVTMTEEGPQDVYLSFTPGRYAYVKSKPIIGSQSKNPVSEDDQHYRPGRVTIKLRAHINGELEQQILSFGPDCEVVAPESFRRRLREKVTAMSALYDDEH